METSDIQAAFGGLRNKKVFLQPKGSLEGYRRSHFRLGDLKNTDSLVHSPNYLQPKRSEDFRKTDRLTEA